METILKGMQLLGVGRPLKSYITLREEGTWPGVVNEGNEENRVNLRKL